MMIIAIADKNYKVATEWNEISYKLAQKVNEIKKPKTLLAVYNAKTKEDFELATKGFKKVDNIGFFREVIACLSDCPIEILKGTDNGIVDFYFNYLEHVVLDLYNMYPFSYKFRKLEYFKFKGVKFYLPTTKHLMNDTQPLADESVASFIEGMNAKTNTGKGFTNLSGLNAITSIFARPKEVDYTETGTIERANMFENLTMDNHWEVFFCLTISLQESVKITSIFLKKAKEKVALN